jgi:tryptophan 2,3-dioxygenase
MRPEIIEKVSALEAKYATMGQDLPAYLEGLLHARYLTYWDYLHLDTLLTLQKPRTDFPDEITFICYHQITELYFKLIQHELDLLLKIEVITDDMVITRLGRIIAYFKNLCHSFDVMVGGMSSEEFLQFRMSLLPASGFQSAQYRQIELKITGLKQLLHHSVQAQYTDPAPIAAYESIYWKFGNLELRSGQKTLTLQMFERQYDTEFRALAQAFANQNLRYRYLHADRNSNNFPVLTQQLRDLDLYANVFWRLSHYRAAAHYLQRDPKDIAATGGTNWQQYLPPRFQRIIFFPELWSENEIQEWGKAWVLSLFNEKVQPQWHHPMAVVGRAEQL